MEEPIVATASDDALEAEVDDVDLGDGAEKKQGEGFIDNSINL